MLCLFVGDAMAQDQAQDDEPERDANGDIIFLHALDNQPIEFSYRPEQEITPAVERFHKTAENPYSDDPAAIEAGEKLYAKLCQACHLEDGTGRIGPNLVDDSWLRERTGTDRGEFEIIYAGGAGAMQAFGRRIDQDEILRLMAYLEVLREDAND
jgi:cytochrome c-L